MIENVAVSSLPEQRSPKGFVPAFAISSFGIYVAVMAPVYGGLSVKVQDLVGLEAAAPLLGILTGSGAIFASLVQPVAGRLSDRSLSRFGRRRPFMFWGTLGAILGLLAAGLAPNFTTLLIAWCFVQFSINFTLAAHHTTLADQVPEAKRGGVSGVIGAATPAAILGGSILLATMPTTFLRFAVPAAFGLVLMGYFLLVLKDKVRDDAPRGPFNLKEVFSSYVFSPKKNPDFGWAWLSKAFVLLGFGSVSTYLTLFLANDFGMDTKAQLSFNAIAQVVSIGTLIVFSLIGGFLSDRIGKRKVFVTVAGLTVGAGVALIAVSPTFGASGLAVLLIGQAIMGAGSGAFFAVDQALCIDLLPNKDEMAKDLGILNLAGTIPGALAPLMAGLIFIPLGNALFSGGFTLWFAVGASSAIAGAIMVTKIKGSR